MSPETFPRQHKGREWKLTTSAFERLLSALDPDRERASLAYEALRERTIGLLEWWGAIGASELADETFDRVARKLEEGTFVPQGSLGPFVRGVARMVFYESTREPLSQLEDTEVPLSEESVDVEPALACLDECLAAMSSDDRTLVLRYYDNDKKLRPALANELGISMTALRIRTCRLRARLEACVVKCMTRR
jgi:DNA-directed RNA polymerase specialized sigma24 family protein